jgi:hypothetical protein
MQMVKMVSLRTFRLASKSGNVIMFEAKEPKDVHPDAVSEAMAAGCVPVDQADANFHEDLSRAKVEFHGDVRRSVILLALQAIVGENNTKHFDGSGIPKASVVSDRVGFDVLPAELRAQFELYMTSRKESTDLALHPEAANILRVVEAASKNELLGLAEEFGTDVEKAKGLSAREIRKVLLAKFAGVALG